MKEEEEELLKNTTEEIVEETIEEGKSEPSKNNEEDLNNDKIVQGEVTNTNIKDGKTKKIVIIIVILLLCLIFTSTIFAVLNINNEKIIKGVSVQKIDISDSTDKEALNKLKEKVEIILKRDITLKYGDYSTSITPQQIELEIKYEDAVKKAQKLGKTNNIIVDNYSILKAALFKTDIDIQIDYNKDILSDIIKSISLELPGAVKEVSYEISGKKLIITKGKSGIYIDSDKLEKDIIDNIKKQLGDIIDEIEIPIKEKQADPIDIEKIYSEIYKEAKDAYIEENPFKLHVEEDGLDFAISMEEAKKIISEDKDTYEIPLKINKAKIKTEDLGNKIFNDTLSKYTTIYDAGNYSRGTNIAIAARTINGTIILPGETFSYNGVLGNTTKEKGYQLGGAYVNGKVVPAYGGGICQVSTTLYNAVLYANLEIVERHNHSYSVSYVPPSRDATVSYGAKDFKFKNSRTYPIKIVASAGNGVISISLKGIKEEKEYDIEITSTTLSTSPFKTTYQENNELAEGKQKVIQVGHNGMKSQAYKIVKYNGKIISKTLLSADTYKPMNRIIEKGTKEAAKKDNKKETITETNKEENTEETTIEEAEITENED